MTKKRCIISILAMVVAGGVFGQEAEDFSRKVDPDIGLVITGYSGRLKVVKIPLRIDRRPVAGIGDRAFADNQLTRVTIGNSVRSIGYKAFAGNQLTELTIPDSVTTIREDAFLSSKLKSITIGADVDVNNASFTGKFKKVYYDRRRRAGTYEFDDKGKSWAKQ
jgi:hypothetical protein